MDLRLVSTPLDQAAKLGVVGLAEVKAHARISHSDEDDLLKSYIETAYDYLSGPTGWLGRCCLLKEDWEAFLPASLGWGFELPLRPLIGTTLTGFAYLQGDGTTYAAVNPSVFNFVPNAEPFALIGRSSSGWWPYVGMSHPRAYRIQFSAGFGTTGTAVPSPIKQAIKMLVAHWNENREATGSASQQVQFGLKALCGRYRISPDHS